MLTRNAIIRQATSYIASDSYIDGYEDYIYSNTVTINGDKPTIKSEYGETNGGSTSLYGYYGMATALYQGHMVRKSISSLRASSTSYVTTNQGSEGVYFSTGGEPESPTNCAISGDIITTYSSTHKITYSFDENGATTTVVYTITNTGTDAFTIGEIGVIGYMNTKHNSKTRYYIEYFLWDRTVLETPVTIEPGGVGQVTYTLRNVLPPV
jgi:hypothetical protein